MELNISCGDDGTDGEFDSPVNSRWLVAVGGVEVWGNGAAFDNVILSNAYRKSGAAQPWKFWNDRCYRTVKAMNPQVTAERIGTYHNAVDDAETQAIHLCKILFVKY